MIEIEYRCPLHPDAPIESDYGDVFCSRCGREPERVEVEVPDEDTCGRSI